MNHLDLVVYSLALPLTIAVVQVLKEGEHTGATPGRALAGPGKVR